MYVAFNWIITSNTNNKKYYNTSFVNDSEKSNHEGKGFKTRVIGGK